MLVLSRIVPAYRKASDYEGEHNGNEGRRKGVGKRQIDIIR